jgi:glycosyltransferase involved in cell wall biosynthesis
MEIVIYDTEHFETTYAIIRIFDVAKNTITIFANNETAFVLKQMLKEDAQRVNWIIKSKKDYSYAIQLYKYCNKKEVTHLFLNTVSYHHIFLGLVCLFLKKTNSILTVHAANSFFDPKIEFSTRSIARFIGKKLLAVTVSSYVTLLSSTKKYIEQKYKINKPVYCIPGGVFEPNKNFVLNKAHGKSVKLVVPGSIDRYRRNYHQIFELAKELEAKKQHCEVVLLGAAIGSYGKYITDLCSKTALQYVSIHFYSSFISAEEFSLQLKSCDFVFLPLEKFCRKHGEQTEEYGLTLCSGSFFDAIRFAKPILLPDNVNLPEELIQQCIRYNSCNNLGEMLARLTSAEKEHYQQRAINNSLNFTLPAVRASLADLIK